MSHASYDTIASTEEKQDVTVHLEDYAKILDSFRLHYMLTEYYYQVGNIEQVQGWILHISVIQPQVIALLETIIPVLIRNTIPFKVVKDKDSARSLLDGLFGSNRIGKVITIYPPASIDFVKLAKELIPLTEGVKGPNILTDTRLGGNLYTRYGSYNPVKKSDASGKPTNYIYNHRGELVPDEHTIPFSLPRGIEWPFAAITQPIIVVPKKILHEIYKPITALKADPRGDVIKALYLKKPFLVKSCVIKQGRRNMSADEGGRDIIDRLKWQHETHTNLLGIIPLPKILSFFEEDEDGYLAMEFVKGSSLYSYINELNCQCETWLDLPIHSKQIILGYLEQLIQMVAAIHQEGYVHRDITPVNFIIERQKLRPIDVELAYSWKKSQPNPAFQLGTPGFMSPEQCEVRIPTVKEDVYGVGATIITLLIGLPPGVFDTSDRKLLLDNLYFFLRDKEIVNVISACLDSNPALRPTIEKVLSAVQVYKKSLEEDRSAPPKSISQNYDEEILKEVIHCALKGLVSHPMLIDQGLWYSKASSKGVVAESLKKDFEKSVGLYEGISGVLYMLARSKKMGFNIEPCLNSYAKGWEYIRQKSITIVTDPVPGLYGGAAGVALALKSGLEADLIENTSENRSILLQLLSLNPIGIDVATGAAGQGITALQCSQFLKKEELQLIVKKQIDILLSSQQAPGVWVTIQEGTRRPFSAASFSNGNTGIVWFLLEYLSQNNDNAVQKVVNKSLVSLLGLKNSIIKVLSKKGYRGSLENPQTCDGAIGIILVFIKAYEVLKEDRYRRLAENILTYYPSHLVHENLSQDVGITGLGEAYLEMYRVSHNTKWLNRAKWIVEFLKHTARKQTSGTCYWLSNNATYPTADLMVGNSGIIHFLIRYLKKDKLGYRLLL